jgi:uncharacterized protein (TIGR02594 family)
MSTLDERRKAIQRHLGVVADGVFGPQTIGALEVALKIEPPLPPGEPMWLTVAKRELGVAEVPGSGNNPRIVLYHTATTLGAKDDEVPWCSAFVNWALARGGVKGTNNAMARSFLKWGIECAPRIGAIVVFKRGEPPAGHVAFWVGAGDGRVRVLGGNQGDRVSIASYPAGDVLAYRWPA